MTTASVLASTRRNIRNHGVRASIYDLVIRSANRLVYLKTLECVVIEAIDPGSSTLPANFRYVRLDRTQLALFGQVKENELPEEFVRDAINGGDDCYAIVEGNALASYGWYSKVPTPVDRDLRLHFSPQYVYMYKGFTAKAYRGKRLHAIGMTLALNEYRNQGFRGLVAYVESNNFDSLKSCYRMGYKTCGHIRVLRVASRYFIHNGPGCRDYGLNLRADYPPRRPYLKTSSQEPHDAS